MGTGWIFELLPFVLGITIIIRGDTTLAVSDTGCGCGCGKRITGHGGLLAARRARVLDLIEDTPAF
jgi:hypothetical protein